MTFIDLIVLVCYFALVSGIGIAVMHRIKAQDDYFLGGRGFGKLMQTFAAFGAGTGSSDPVNTARTVFTGGVSGMWSVMYWLFMTPFYWITAVWYRRMRLVTLGDWFVERYESPKLGAAYAMFGVSFFMVFSSMLLSAIGKVASPLIGFETFTFNGSTVGLEYILVPVIGIVVLIYGIAGGLHAAYLTDLVQGVCIILLSILLIPFGLYRLVSEFGDSGNQSILDGFKILHEQIPDSQFNLIGGEGAQFTAPFLIVVVLLNLIGVVIQPHFIATGGGSAKTEFDARMGLVIGNLLKRLCTVGWVLTALIALALYGNDPGLIEDPDKTWGVASQRLLIPGLTGMMLACLLAALMSSIDAYMVTGSALIVRNFYAAFVNPNATEKEYLKMARYTGVIIVAGAVFISLMMMDVFKQLQLTWVVPVLFAAPFWLGMYWRGATTSAAWITVIFGLFAFFLVPAFVDDFSLIGLTGVDTSLFSSNTQDTLHLLEKIVSPFVVMFVASLLTSKNSKTALDCYYAKMRTPVHSDPIIDNQQLEDAYANPGLSENKKLFPGTNLEFNKPTATDIFGFLAMIVACMFVVGLANFVVHLEL